jgi:hypothetical protein
MPSYFGFVLNLDQFKGNVGLSIIICGVWVFLPIFMKFDFVTENTD